MSKYHGGKNKGKQLYVKVGDEWMEIKKLIVIEKEGVQYEQVEHIMR